MQANYKRFSLAWIAGKKQEENRRCFGRVSALEARSTGVRYDDGGFSGRLKVAIAVLAPQLQRGRLRAPLSRERSHHHPGSTHGGSGMVREATGRDNPKRRGQAAFPRNPADFRRVPTGPMRPILQNPPPWKPSNHQVRISVIWWHNVAPLLVLTMPRLIDTNCQVLLGKCVFALR